MAVANLCNTCWMALCGREARAFDRATRNVRHTQVEILSRLLRRNRASWYGRQYKFAAIKSIRDFQQAVPLTSYKDYHPAIDRISSGEQNVLTLEPVRRLVPTGGSTSGEKLIPYTDALRRSFQRAIRAWIWDLFYHRPKVRHGRSYWSISPLASVSRRTVGGIPIGFDDDASYLGSLEQQLIRRTMAVPTSVALCPSVIASQYATLFFLLRAGDLSLISVWSPTFFTSLLDIVRSDWPRLCDDIERGTISLTSPADGSTITQRSYRPLPDRAAVLREVFSSMTATDWTPQIWPSLALVSCWADGPSAAYARELQRRLGGVEIQAKGLLATEAFISIPCVRKGKAALAVRCHFFEFQSASADHALPSDALLLAHQLEQGREYRVVVTTEGGLYRYQLRDQVVVVGFENEAPLLRFVGKTDSTSDLVGEKLKAAHVQSALDSAFAECGMQPSFAQLAAEAGAIPCYVLQLTVAGAEAEQIMQGDLTRAVERRLCENPAYAYARKLGQLSQLKIEFLSERDATARTNEYLATRLAAGQRLGDIKPAPLVMRSATADQRKTRDEESCSR
jgi:hypothetical protein